MIVNVYDDDLLNGEGIREVIFLQGCHHHCKGCFNPETWEFKKDTKKSIKHDNKFIDQVISKLKEPYVSGITITGGDPLADSNLPITSLLVTMTKQLHKSVWIYTGYTYEEFTEQHPDIVHTLLKDVDVICDGKFIESLKSPEKPWVGSSNQRVIDVQKSLKENKIILYIN